MAAAYPGQARAVQILQDAPRPPQLIVFDLDYTLWPFWCEMYTVNDTPSLYPESRGILEACRELNIPMAIASRTPTPKVAKAFMNKLGLSGMFESVQLIPASSGYDHHSAQKDTDHLPAIHRETNIPYTEMIFFDDEFPNISKVARLSVTSVLVSLGMSVDILQTGLKQHAANGKSQRRQ
ncbi:g7513 [Coccomyxa elongata]